MKFYSYEDIYLLSHGNPSLLLEYFKDSNKGKNFIVNPKSLVDAFWVTDRHKAEYLGICALRSYDDYLTKGTVDLSLDLIPDWVHLEVITDNPLVTITETKIILKKENIYNVNNFIR
jgi:hypothetical protein